MQLQLIDTHCHPNFNIYKVDADEVVRRSLDNKVGLNIVGSQNTTSKRAVEYAERYDQGVYATIGLHPIHLFDLDYGDDDEENLFVTRAEDFEYEYYRKLGLHEKVIAIGEIGLDYYHLPVNVSLTKVKERQKLVFTEQIKLAQDLNKPIVIHTRPSKGTYNAYEDVLRVLSEIDGKVKGVVHSYAGTKEQADKFMELGFYFGFNGIVTFKNALEIRELVEHVPLERILTETDAPYLTPEPHRGKRNEPVYVEYVAERIAGIKETTSEEVARVTVDNARKLFNLP